MMIYVNFSRELNQLIMGTGERYHKHKKIVDFASGLIAGLMSVIVCNPLDIARTRLNVQKAPSHSNSTRKYLHFSDAMKTIWKEEGWRGFYNGFRTNVVGIPIFHSMFFPLYEYVKQTAQEKGLSHEQSYLLGTLTAGSIVNIITNPIWVVRTRLMAQYLHHESNHYQTTSPFKIIAQMYRHEGIHALFKGLVPSLLSVSNAMVYFSCYENLKTYLEPQLSVMKIFFCSTVSKIAATTLTYPIVVIRTVMFDFRGWQKDHFSNIVNHIMQKNGMKGFYAGLKPDLIRLIPSNAIVFIVYEYLKVLLQ